MSQATPNQGIQTTTIAQLPVRYSHTPTVGYQPRTVYAGQWSSSPPATTPGYAYPTQQPNYAFAGTRPTNTLGLAPLGNQPYQPTSFYQPNQPYTIAQNCPTCVGGTTTTTYPVPNYSPVQSGTGVGTSAPAIIGTPSLSAPQPSVTYGVPQYAPVDPAAGYYGVPQTWNNPTLAPANRTNYSPLLSLRNLPPGTYIGQGILGQPKAYIDGEPIRNLLRYMSY